MSLQTSILIVVIGVAAVAGHVIGKDVYHGVKAVAHHVHHAKAAPAK